MPIFLQVAAKMSDALYELAEGNEKRLVFGDTPGAAGDEKILVEVENTQV